MTGHHRDGAAPRIGLELRVDDSLVRSSELHELLARVHAVLRQLDAGLAAPARDPERRHFRFCGWQLDSTTRRLTDPAGAPVPLTTGEYTLLVVFLNAPQRPLSREYLVQATHLHEGVSDRSIDVRVLRLRRKLEPRPGAPRIIRTERGAGYLFTVPVQRI
jgi:DNA-binding response OmpR family regulator